MKLNFECGAHQYSFDQAKYFDISLRLDFHGAQVSAYGVPRATAAAYLAGVQPLDTRQGAGCNCEEYRLITHCHVTHTECVGHITTERLNVLDTLSDTLIPCMVISIQPLPADETGNTYAPALSKGDLLVTREALEAQLSKYPEAFRSAVIVRTLPNTEQKRTRNYLETPASFLSLEAASFLLESGVQHLLVDLPSVDRMFDEGRLSAHHIFWELAQGSHSLEGKPASSRTITEFIYVPNEVEDGVYLLNMQVASLSGDAAPARPILFPLTMLQGVA